MWRIGSRLIALTTLAAGIPAAFAFWSIWEHYQLNRQQTAVQVDIIAQALSGEGGRIMSGGEQLLDILATFPSVRFREADECNRIIRGVQAAVPHYSLIAVADQSGGIFCASRDIPRGIPVARQNWFKSALENQHGYAVSELVADNLVQTPVIQFSRVVGDGTVVLASLDIRKLADHFREFQVPSDISVSIIDRLGNIIYRFPETEAGVGTRYPDRDVIALARDVGEGRSSYMEWDGSSKIVAIRPLSNVWNTGILVVVERATHGVTVVSQTTLLVNLAVLVVTVLSAAFVGWAGTRVMIVQGLDKVCDSARLLAAGALNVRVGKLGSAIEIRNLASSFDSMAETLSNRQRELEEAVEWIETSTDLAGLGIFDWDIRKDTMTWNRKHYLLFGLDPDSHQASFETFAESVEPEDFDRVNTAINEARIFCRDYREEYRIRTPSGEVRWMLGIGRFLYAQNGDPVRMRGVVLDISDRKNAEEALRRAQKMDALGQMVGGVAHDVNNILGIISANLQLAEVRRSEENIELGIATSLSATKCGAELVRRLLAFSRRQPMAIGAFDVRQEIDRLRPLISKAVNQSVLACDYAEDIWPAQMDASEFGDALLNLVLNAAQAMPNGGNLRISVENVTLDQAQSNAGQLTPGDYVMVAVTDEGDGIDPAILDKVFDPFFTTKHRTNGSGLGLSMVYGFVRRCGGGVQIDSQLGMGTTVRLYLPRADACDLPKATSHQSVPKFGGGLSVLVVDDELDIAHAVRNYLLSLGYEVFTAGSPQQAIKVMNEVGRVDLLFSDIILSGSQSGVDLAVQLRRTHPDLKVLLTTGSAEIAPSGGGASAQFPIIAKPYTFEDLRLHIEAQFDPRQSTAMTYP